MSKKLILVVEDNTIVALDISRRLKRLGYRVIPYPVISGEAAIEKVEMRRPDLVLMDIQLKGKIDGIQAAEIISKRFGTPFIYITAHSDPSTRQRAQRTNPAGYLIKPFVEAKFLQILGKVLDPKPQVKMELPSYPSHLILPSGGRADPAGGRKPFGWEEEPRANPAHLTHPKTSTISASSASLRPPTA